MQRIQRVQKELGKSHSITTSKQKPTNELFADESTFSRTIQMEEMKEEKRKNAKPWF